MKKLITSLTLVMLVAFTFGQVSPVNYQGREILNVSRPTQKIKNTKVSNSKSASRWYNYGFATENYLQSSNNFNANFLFPDSAIKVIYAGGDIVGGPWIHALGEVLDITSFYWNNTDTDLGELLLNSNSTFTLDSIEMVCVYNRNHPNTSIVDTLVVEVLVNNPTEYDNYFFTGASAANFGVDTLFFVGLKYNQPANCFNMVGKYTYKIPLTAATAVDTNALGFNVIGLSTSNIPISTFKFISASYKFIPGYSYSWNDLLEEKNSFRFISFEENEDQYMMSYNKRDYNASYIVSQEIRYNNAGSWNDNYIPACAFLNYYRYEHHWINYKLTGVSNYDFVSINNIQNSSICQGESFSVGNNIYNTSGTYIDTLTNYLGFDSIVTTNLTVIPISTNIQNPNICQGESISVGSNIYTTPGTYIDTLINYLGCDSIITTNLTVLPLPQQFAVLQNPNNGVLQSGNSGQISLSTSVVGTKYWVTMGGAPFANEINGTGTTLNLGSNYPEGSYNVWSRHQNGCELLQGNANFVENTGTNKIVANVTFGSPESNFPANHTKVALYKKTTDIGGNQITALQEEQLLGNNGQANFNNLQPGIYYLGSFIQYPDNYNVAPHIYYQTAVVHENADSIPVIAGTLFIATLHHVELPQINGSNIFGGTVLEDDGKKNLSPLKDIVVILRNMSTNEIIGVSVTDVNGAFSFEKIPNNTNIQVFVTSLAHQNWIPYAVQTGSSQTYNVNFIVDGNNVYPQSSSGIENKNHSEINFSIFPNPSKDIIILTGIHKKSNMLIYDISGKLVRSEIIFNNSKINVSGFKLGTYIVVLSNENGETGVQKFVKE